jgi:hypothetical protein
MSQLPKRAIMTGLLASFLAASAQTPSTGHEHTPRVLAIASPTAGVTEGSPVAVSYTVNGKAHAVSSKTSVYLLIDQPTPEPGASITADANHVPFPEGQTQVSVPLGAGSHTLQLVALNSKGEISTHVEVAAPISITTK